MTGPDDTTPTGTTAPGPRHGTSALVVATVLAVLATVGVSLLLADELPARVPSHWSGFGGLSDDSTPLAGLTALFVLLELLMGAVFVLPLRSPAPAWTQRTVVGTGVGTVLLMAGSHVVTLVAARGTDGPIPFPRGPWAGMLLVAVLLGLLAAAIARPGPHTQATVPVPPVELAPGEGLVWSGRAPVPTVLVAGALVAALLDVLLVVLLDLPAFVAVVGAVVLLAVVMVTSVRVTVGPAGLTLALGPFALLRRRTPLAAIRAADAVAVAMLTYGGLGYRVLPGTRAIVTRQGPGLEVERVDAPTLVVTLDDAATAAGVLRAHLAGRDGTGPATDPDEGTEGTS